jgi:2-polyprenyl-3-methyl-5-hydroxy-6-metoxy-1,4-benzoquinol methylase
LSEHHIKVDYASHDAAYKRNREQGLPGWDSAVEIEEHIIQLSSIFSRAEVPKTGKVLDIGCGAGNISFWLEQQGFEVWGIDVSSVAIKWAKEYAESRASQVQFSVADATKDEFLPQQRFDIILDNHCLHCIIGKDRNLYLNSIYQKLEAQGIYICTTMCGQLKDKDILPHYDANSRCIIRNNIAIRYIGTPEDIIDEIQKAGLHILYQEVSTGEIQDTLCLIANKR